MPSLPPLVSSPFRTKPENLSPQTYELLEILQKQGLVVIQEKVNKIFKLKSTTIQIWFKKNNQITFSLHSAFKDSIVFEMKVKGYPSQFEDLEDPLKMGRGTKENAMRECQTPVSFNIPSPKDIKSSDGNPSDNLDHKWVVYTFVYKQEAAIEPDAF